MKIFTKTSFYSLQTKLVDEKQKIEQAKLSSHNYHTSFQFTL